jgi:hypothetical protein
MDLLTPTRLRLVPGQGVHGAFSARPGEPSEIGFFVRSATGFSGNNSDLQIHQRAGVIRFNDVTLVLTMIKVENGSAELFDVWWNYCAAGAADQFRQMSEQERLSLHLYGEGGVESSLEVENGFRRFFSSLPEVFERQEPWTEVDFDRAVRGFCAQAYPKENLWDMIQLKAQPLTASDPPKVPDIDDYPGTIPEDLRPFYTYIPGQGHCIRTIPSTFEDRAIEGDPTEFIHAAPVKTVLRCGVRWAKGYPVAPIPFIPGRGLAVPPDDTEL